MKTLNYKDNRSIKKDVKPLFLKAFPKDERPPAYYFFKSALKEGNDIYAYYIDNEFVGFTYLSIYKDICYIFFLAVSEKKRNQGIGSQVIQDVKDKHQDKVLLLCYEEVDEKYSDNENRIKRREFYRKNGFKDNELKTNEFGVVFETGYIGSHKVPFEDYVEIFVNGFSEYARPFIKKES